jgi:hypothetical protein
MTKEDTIPSEPSFARFILWEILGIVGFLHILQYAPANDPTPLCFLANAVGFMVLYPILYFYNRLKLPLVLKFLVSPLSLTLRSILMISGFFWVAYVLYATGYSLGLASGFVIFRRDYLFLGPFFVFDYFFFVEHLWGLSRANYSFWGAVGMISDSISGVVGGYYLGRTLDTKWGMFFGDPETRGLIWIIFILIGIGAVVWFGNKTRKG